MAYQSVEVITNLTDIKCNTIEEFYENIFYNGLNKFMIHEQLLRKCIELNAPSNTITAIESYLDTNPTTIDELDIETQKLTRTRIFPDKFTNDAIYK